MIAGRELAGDKEAWYVPLEELVTGKLHTVIAPYWFVICLLTMNIIFSVAYGLLSDKRVMFLVLGCVPALNLLPQPDVFELHYALKFFPYMVLGSLFFISEKGRANLCLSFVAGCACCYILYKVVNADEELFGWSNAYGLVYTLVILVLSKILEKLTCSRILSLLRSGALVLLATQNYIIGFARIVLDRLTHQDDFLVNHIVFKPLVLLAVYAITLPLIWLIVNYAPFVLGKKKIATK